MSCVKQKNKVALVTGAARRVGAEIATQLHGRGMNVLLHCNSSRTEAKALCEKLNQIRADSARVLPADLSAAGRCNAFCQAALGVWERLDVIVNNASVFYPTALLEVGEEDWERMLTIHIKTPFFLVQHLAAELKRQKGCIVNVTDIHTDRPLKGYLAYSVSKAGMVALTKSLARELAPDVRCNAVAPGAILWPEHSHHEAQHREIIARTALKREGKPQDIAQAVLFLVENANYITGQIIVVDGGRTLSN